MFLSTFAEWRIGGGSPAVPAKARAGQFWALTGGLTFLMDSSVVLRLRAVSPFTSGRFRHEATPVLLLPLKKRPLRQRSLHRPRRRTISPVAYTFDLPTAGRRRASPVMTQDHSLQAAAGATPVVRRRHSARPATGGNQDFPSASSRGGDWRTTQAETAVSRSLPAWPLRDDPFFRTPRRNRPGCVPPLKVAEFGQRVLNEHGPAQVGLGVICPPFSPLPFVRGELPLRLDLVPSHCGSRTPLGPK